MEREIKFRGISSFSKKWVYGNYIMIDGQHAIASGSIEYIDGSELRSESWDFVIPESIGQYTGLKDKNKEDVYEGDILRSVRFEDIILFVAYDEEEASFMAVQINKNRGTELESRCHITQKWLDEYPKVVIGNIHDNPELLEE